MTGCTTHRMSADESQDLVGKRVQSTSPAIDSTTNYKIVNKTSVVVQLKHIPTGLSVKCQETRYQGQNRILARKQLRLKVDDLLLGEGSRSAIKRTAEKKRALSKQKKSKRKYRALEATPTMDTTTSGD